MSKWIGIVLAAVLVMPMMADATKGNDCDCIQEEIAFNMQIQSQLRSAYADVRRNKATLRRALRRGSETPRWKCVEVYAHAHGNCLYGAKYYAKLPKCPETKDLAAVVSYYTAVEKVLRAELRSQRNAGRTLRTELRNALRSGKCNQDG